LDHEAGPERNFPLLLEHPLVRHGNQALLIGQELDLLFGEVKRLIHNPIGESQAIAQCQGAHIKGQPAFAAQ